MNLTKLKLLSTDITKFEFEDFASQKNASSSGVLKITLERQNSIDTSENSIHLFFSGTIAAFEGEESEESNHVFNLDVEFTMKYSGEFDVDELSNHAKESDWFFKKDASIFLHGAVNQFLSDTFYRSVKLPYQQ